MEMPSITLDQEFLQSINRLMSTRQGVTAHEIRKVFGSIRGESIWTDRTGMPDGWSAELAILKRTVHRPVPSDKCRRYSLEAQMTWWDQDSRVRQTVTSRGYVDGIWTEPNGHCVAVGNDPSQDCDPDEGDPLPSEDDGIPAPPHP